MSLRVYVTLFHAKHTCAKERSVNIGDRFAQELLFFIGSKCKFLTMTFLETLEFSINNSEKIVKEDWNLELRRMEKDFIYT